jgi:hypothetical protein
LGSSAINIAYGSSGAAFTITLNSLAYLSAQSSLAVANNSNLFLDALVTVIIASGATGVEDVGTCDVYAYGSVDGGSTYPEGCGTNTSVTLTNPTNLRRIGTVNVVANSTTYESEPMSVAAAFGGVMPQYWGICVVNNSGAALGSSGNSAMYQGIYAQVA